MEPPSTVAEMTTSYQVTTSSGNTIEFETDLSPRQAFAIVAAIEPRNSFHDWILKGCNHPTEKQILWALKVAQDVVTSRNPNVGPGPYIGIVKKIQELQSGTKVRVALRFEELILKSVTRGSNIGSVHLFRGKDYVGKITVDGYVKADPSVKSTLNKISADPVKAAREYGRATGSCSYCGRPLSDPVSVYGGIGPVCLAKLAGDDAREELVQEYQEHVYSNLLDKVLATV